MTLKFALFSQDYNFSLESYDSSWDNINRGGVEPEENLEKPDVVFDHGLPFLASNEDLEISTQQVYYVPWNSEIGHMPEECNCEVNTRIVNLS